MAEDCWLQARLYLGLEHSPEQQDNESLCFSILVGHGQSHTFRVELATDLAIWEKSFQRAVFLEVQRMRVSISMCNVANVPVAKLKESACVVAFWKLLLWLKQFFKAEEPPTTPLPNLKGWHEAFVVSWNKDRGATLSALSLGFRARRKMSSTNSWCSWIFCKILSKTTITYLSQTCIKLHLVVR